MLPNQTSARSVLPDPSMPYALDSLNRGRLCQSSASHKDTKGLTLSLKHCTGLPGTRTVLMLVRYALFQIQYEYYTED